VLTATDTEIDVELLKSEIKKDVLERLRRARARFHLPDRARLGRGPWLVISNGVIDLIPDKDAVFAELHRVLTPGGRIQIADVTIQNPVSEEGRRNIDLWTG
jgi:hypothetical protein